MGMYSDVGIVMFKEDYDLMRQKFKGSKFEENYLVYADIFEYTNNARDCIGIEWDRIKFYSDEVNEFLEYLAKNIISSGTIFTNGEEIEFITNSKLTESGEVLYIDNPFSMELLVDEEISTKSISSSSIEDGDIFNLFSAVGVCLLEEDYNRMREHFKGSSLEKHINDNRCRIFKYIDPVSKDTCVGIKWNVVMFRGKELSEFMDFIKSCEYYTGIMCSRKGVKYIDNPLRRNENGIIKTLNNPFMIDLSIQEDELDKMEDIKVYKKSKNTNSTTNH